MIHRLVGGNRRFGISDGLETGFHFEVEREIPVVRGVRGVGLQIETAASGFIRTGALDDPPGLSKFVSESDDAIIW